MNNNVILGYSEYMDKDRKVYKKTVSFIHDSILYEIDQEVPENATSLELLDYICKKEMLYKVMYKNEGVWHC
jgi:hypothetical protein